MKTGIIIQARTGSTRLPKKMIMPFFQDRTILEIIVERIQSTVSDIDIVVATTESPNDDAIVDISNSLNVNVYRGSEIDVLNRFIGAAEKYHFDGIIRVCGDNPFLSMNYLKELFNKVSDSECDYVSFRTSDGTPSIKTHFGLWTEYITLDALKRIDYLTNESLYHEHVTNFAYGHPDTFSLDFLSIPNFITNSRFRLTVDTVEDFQTAQKVFEQLHEKHLEIEPENIIPLLDEKILNRMRMQIEENSK